MVGVEPRQEAPMRRLALVLLTAAAFAPLASSRAQTGDQPVRKPGWWELQVVVSGPTPEPQRQTAHMCTDAATDKASFMGPPAPGCPTPKMTKTGAGWSVTTKCDLGQMKLTADAVATGDFNDRYHIDIDTRMDPPPAPQLTDIKVAVDAHWVGLCPAGRKPGDTVDANGNLVTQGGGP
jgi:hypothetical protein